MPECKKLHTKSQNFLGYYWSVCTLGLSPHTSWNETTGRRERERKERGKRGVGRQGERVGI